MFIFFFNEALTVLLNVHLLISKNKIKIIF